MKVIFAFFVLGCLMTGAKYGIDRIKPRIVEKVIQVQKPEPDIKALFQIIPAEYGIHPLVIRAMFDQESYGGKRDAIRFEEGQLRYTTQITSNPSERMMYASSHGPMQVMGWWAPKLGLKSWLDLYDPKTNIESGCRILKGCFEQQKKITDKRKRLFNALACYNGSGPKAQEYASQMMERIERRLIEEYL